MMFGDATPPLSRVFHKPAGSLIRSHGLKPLYRSGRTFLIEHQNALFVGSQKFGPHVVTASLPPGRTRLQSSFTALAISGTKKIPNTHTTASKLAKGNLIDSMSPISNLVLPKRRSIAFVRADSRSCFARSTPMTFPIGPTASAAGRAEAPAPQQTSSTREPIESEASSIVRRPK